MRRDEFIKSILSVRRALRDSGLLSIIMKKARTGSREDKDAADILRAYANFMVDYNRFTEFEKSLLGAFELQPIIEPAFWEKIIGMDREPQGRSSITPVYYGARMLDEYVPKFVMTLGRVRKTNPIVVGKDKGKGKGTQRKALETESITLFIREADVPSLSASQFADVLEASQALYSVILKMNGLEHTDLIVGALDSGSDKSVDVIGVASAIAKLSDFLLQCWDKVRFAQPLKVSAHLKTASEGITLLKQIDSAVTSGAMSEVEAEKLRRVVLKSVENLFSNGVYTGQMDSQVVVRPSALPIERRKLITHQPSSGQVVDDAANAGSDEGDDEEPNPIDMQ